MNIETYYIWLILSYVNLGVYGLILNWFNTDIIYLVCIMFISIGIVSIVVDVVESKKKNKEPFYPQVYKNKEFLLISFLNYMRFTLLTTALSFKNLGVVIATYSTYSIFVAIMSKTILHIKLYKKEIAGVIIAMIGILIINYSSLKAIFNAKFSNKTVYEFLYPLFGAVVSAYQVILSKKYTALTANNVVTSQFVPVIPITIFFACIRSFYPFRNMYEYLEIPYIPFNLTKGVYIFLYMAIAYYLCYLIIFLFVKKYSALLACMIGYVSVYVGFIVQRFYFKIHIKYYQLFSSLLILAGIILTAYTEHHIKNKK